MGDCCSFVFVFLAIFFLDSLKNPVWTVDFPFPADFFCLFFLLNGFLCKCGQASNNHDAMAKMMAAATMRGGC